MVDVGGHRLHIACRGEGGPTVVLDAALGNMSTHWTWVQQELAQTGRVCAYDRAGLGWSEPGPEPRDARQVTSELHALLTNASIPGPYVMVGHSFGGLYAQLYAARYPDQVAGVVLVESSHPQVHPATRRPAELQAGPTAVQSRSRPDPVGCGPDVRPGHVLGRPGATHTSLVDDPEYARETSAATGGVVDTARTHQPLTP